MCLFNVGEIILNYVEFLFVMHVIFYTLKEKPKKKKKIMLKSLFIQKN